ncbi:MAG: hypothetical protein ACTHOL_18155 [Luteibacter jiangsuensis]
MPLSKRTKRFREISASDLAGVKTIISAGSATEDRGHLPLWREIENGRPGTVVWMEDCGKSRAHVSCGSREFEVNLTDGLALDEIVRSESLLIDISGLPHGVWAPILGAAYRSKIKTRVVYAEPDSYKEHPNPVSASLFDLSVTLGGLAPLPGFARLSGPVDEDKCIFVALLGFEGNRPVCLAQQVDPAPKVISVVGVPGFQIEYPMFTIACNRDFLEDYRSNGDIRFARASCPFELITTLKDILKDYPDHYFYVAPVGTKPHALGAIIFALMNPANSEIMFDHPIRKPGRTSGVGIIHLFDFGSFDDL